MVYVLVGLAGFIGAVLRNFIGIVFSEKSTVFPISTLIVNLLGCFLLSWFTTVVFKKISFPAHFKTAIATGFVGSFTTFSTLSVETVHLLKSSDPQLGVLYVMVSLSGGLIMSRLGFIVGKEEKSL
ncbi:fluoride efflux transporter CrcB [Peribacillus saganii]|uniref:Fluoride-specific ion channel FluC n=1 Tax=Peribacillus saganii TaxID=2303992 RepID=A0A372LM17_9BACI|nr:fluoride efflux transporter CrcB [Peribacillus saganii]RFU68120.1 fluoride efflux transporter CrcB [Peribacillus saganii]